MARKTVDFNKSGIGKLPNDKPILYKIQSDGGKTNYAGNREARPRPGTAGRASARGEGLRPGCESSGRTTQDHRAGEGDGVARHRSHEAEVQRSGKVTGELMLGHKRICRNANSLIC